MIQIRKAKESDFKKILSLVKGLALFQNAIHKVGNSVAQMKREKEFFHGFVAEDEKDGIVGIAIYFFAYFTWVGKSLYLDDLYVKEDYRGKGIGSMLLNSLFEEARITKCNRVRWQVSAWNKPAIEFYAKCGAMIDGTESNCDFDQLAIENFHINNK